MTDELARLLDIALDREIASQTFYIAGQTKTTDPGAVQLMKELAEEEQKHYEWIKKFKETGRGGRASGPKAQPDLGISDNLVDMDIKEGAGLQDVITTAIKREEYSIEFYGKMKIEMTDEAGKRLCDKLMGAERGHKKKLEVFYDDLYYKEN
jgi:rubrerythrin